MYIVCSSKIPKKLSYQQLFNVLTSPCRCQDCQIRIKQIQAILVIRNFIRKILITKKENLRHLSSLRDVDYNNRPKWLNNYYHKLLDKHFIYHNFDINFT